LTSRRLHLTTFPALIFLILFIWPGQAYAAPAIWKVLLAEAASEGEQGMYAVACVIRNRGGDLRGFCGSRRKGLDGFCERQGRKYISLAQAIEKRVFEEQAPDITNGATHFENTKAFGIPSWAKTMIVTARIKAHTFYRERGR
jgi:hypothetical protein